MFVSEKLPLAQQPPVVMCAEPSELLDAEPSLLATLLFPPRPPLELLARCEFSTVLNDAFPTALLRPLFELAVPRLSTRTV
jgi:hypothetical protein